MQDDDPLASLANPSYVNYRQLADFLQSFRLAAAGYNVCLLLAWLGIILWRFRRASSANPPSKRHENQKFTVDEPKALYSELTSRDPAKSEEIGGEQRDLVA